MNETTSNGSPGQLTAQKVIDKVYNMIYKDDIYMDDCAKWVSQETTCCEAEDDKIPDMSPVLENLVYYAHKTGQLESMQNKVSDLVYKISQLEIRNENLTSEVQSRSNSAKYWEDKYDSVCNLLNDYRAKENAVKRRKLAASKKLRDAKKKATKKSK